MQLQELITRGRFLFSGAPKRLEVFNLLNGKRSSKEIAAKLNRPFSAILKDIQKLRDMGLAVVVRKKDKIYKKEGSKVYNKTPLLRPVSMSYFEPTKEKPLRVHKKPKELKSTTVRGINTIRIPNREELLEICKEGEGQLYEFKQAGGRVEGIIKAISAFAHTKRGGIIFYGIEDDGTISGVDKRKQDFDQWVNNGIRNKTDPPITVDIYKVDVLGHSVFVIGVRPWNRNDIYLFDGKPCIQRGANIFAVTSSELKNLSKGLYID